MSRLHFNRHMWHTDTKDIEVRLYNLQLQNEMRTGVICGLILFPCYVINWYKLHPLQSDWWAELPILQNTNAHAKHSGLSSSSRFHLRKAALTPLLLCVMCHIVSYGLKRQHYIPNSLKLISVSMAAEGINKWCNHWKRRVKIEATFEFLSNN